MTIDENSAEATQISPNSSADQGASKEKKSVLRKAKDKVKKLGSKFKPSKGPDNGEKQAFLEQSPPAYDEEDDHDDSTEEQSVPQFDSPKKSDVPLDEFALIKQKEAENRDTEASVKEGGLEEGNLTDGLSSHSIAEQPSAEAPSDALHAVPTEYHYKEGGNECDDSTKEASKASEGGNQTGDVEESSSGIGQEKESSWPEKDFSLKTGGENGDLNSGEEPKTPSLTPAAEKSEGDKTIFASKDGSSPQFSDKQIEAISSSNLYTGEPDISPGNKNEEKDPEGAEATLPSSSGDKVDKPEDEKSNVKDETEARERSTARTASDDDQLVHAKPGEEQEQRDFQPQDEKIGDEKSEEQEQKDFQPQDAKIGDEKSETVQAFDANSSGEEQQLKENLPSADEKLSDETSANVDRDEGKTQVSAESGDPKTLEPEVKAAAPSTEVDENSEIGDSGRDEAIQHEVKAAAPSTEVDENSEIGDSGRDEAFADAKPVMEGVPEETGTGSEEKSEVSKSSRDLEEPSQSSTSSAEDPSNKDVSGVKEDDKSTEIPSDSNLPNASTGTVKSGEAEEASKGEEEENPRKENEAPPKPNASSDHPGFTQKLMHLIGYNSGGTTKEDAKAKQEQIVDDKVKELSHGS